MTNDDIKERQNKEIFDLLAQNAFDFLQTAVEEAQNKDKLKYSIVHFMLGIEVLLKAELASKNWEDICQDERQKPYTFDKFIGGEYYTIGPDQIKKRLSNVYSGYIDQLRWIRNKYVHFFYTPDISEVTAIQLRAWHHIQLHIPDELPHISKDYKAEIGKIKDILHENRAYLQEKFLTIKDDLSQAYECPICRYDAVESDIKSCRVCEAQELEEIVCRACKEPNYFDGYDYICCKKCDEPLQLVCEHEISPDDISIADLKDKYPRDSDVIESAYCLECQHCHVDATVYERHDGVWICLNCADEYDDVYFCPNCNNHIAYKMTDGKEDDEGVSINLYGCGLEGCQGMADRSD